MLAPNMDYLAAVVLVVVGVVSLGQGAIIRRDDGEDVWVMCARNCLGSRKFNYEVGHIYEYEYKAETTTKMNGASHEGASLKLDGVVIFEPVTKCDMIMKVQRMALQNMDDPSQSRQFGDAITEHPLRFSFQDGKVEELCPRWEESAWVLNVKRGILSAFQNSMDDFDRDVNITETDVVGKCLTEYNVESSHRNTLKIRKTKDLLSCRHRESYHFILQSVQYNSESDIRSLPLLKSYHTCTQMLDTYSNTLTKTECTEENIFRPFSNGKSGAMTIQTQTLAFRTKRAAPQNPRLTEELFRHRNDLLFQHQEKKEGKAGQQSISQEILRNLKELCLKMSEDIRPELPKMLNELIELMKDANLASLRRIYSEISREDFCGKSTGRTKRYFHDALPMLGTVDSVKMFHYLVTHNDFQEEDMVLFVMFLSFTQQPSKEMVETLTPFLDNRTMSSKMLLSISSIAATYCKTNPGCGESYEMEALIDKYIGFVGNCDKARYPDVVQALRALGNIGGSSAKLVPILSRCLSNSSQSLEIRISAINAFRHVPCDDARGSDLMKVFRDEKEKSEIRINAYLALMTCPSLTLLVDVGGVLKGETSNQVGSFVWSHLSNLMKTDDPHLQDIRSVLAGDLEHLGRKYNLDKWKFSRNYEGSFFSEGLNVGARMDGNVIFSSESFIPRSVSLNLTVDLFGNAVNFLEVGTHLENLERNTERSYSSHRMTLLESYNYREKSRFYVRLYGNEIYYGDFRRPTFLLHWKYLLTIFKTMQMVNTQVKYPTLIGLPLELNVKATAAVNNNDQTKWKNRGMDLAIKFSAVVEVVGEMTVNAHVTRKGLKSVSMAHTSTGVEFLSDTRQLLNIRFPQKTIEYANLKTDFFTVNGATEKKHELITSNVKVSKTCSDKSVEHLLGLKFCQEIKYTNASQMKNAPFFPFTGPAHYSYYMENVDVPNGYLITRSEHWQNRTFMLETNGSKLPRKLLIKNEGEAVHLIAENPWRNMTFDAFLYCKHSNFTGMATLNLDKGSKYKIEYNWMNENVGRQQLRWTTRLWVQGPERSGELTSLVHIRTFDWIDLKATATGDGFKPVRLEAKFRNDQKTMSGVAAFVNGPDEYRVGANMTKEVKRYSLRYKPSIKVMALNKVLMELDSDITYEEQNRVLVIIKLHRLRMKPLTISKPVILNVGMTRGKKAQFVEGKIGYKSGAGNARLVFTVGRQSRFVLLYNFGPRVNDKMIMSCKGQAKRTRRSVTYIYNVDVTSKKRAALNFNVKGRSTRMVGKLASSFTVHYTDPSLPKNQNTLKFNTMLTYGYPGNIRKYGYTLSLIDPSKKLNFKVNADHSHTQTWPFFKLENNAVLQIHSDYLIKTGVSFSNARLKGQLKSNAKVSVAYPGTSMEIKEELMQIGTNSYHNQVDVQWQRGSVATLKTSFKHNPRTLFIENVLSLPDNREARMTTTVNMVEPDYKATVEIQADKRIFVTERDIDYKAVSTMKHEVRRGGEISMDATFVVEWAPDRKISTSLKSVQEIGKRMSYRYSITTPFESLQSFSENYNYTNENDNRKYSYLLETMFRSFNKQTVWKEKLTLDLDNKEFYYGYYYRHDYRVMDGEMSLKYKDFQKSAMLLWKENEERVFDVKVTHNRDAYQMKTDAYLMFDVFDNSGEAKVIIHHDDRETASNGDFKYKYLNKNFKIDTVRGSYGMKHNRDMSSGFVLYKNEADKESKIQVILNKDFPNLRGNVFITRERRQMLKINVNYTRLRDDNVDVIVETTAFYTGGENLLLSTNYKMDSLKHTLTFSMGLPDSRRMKAVATFNNGRDQKSLSLNVDSQNFPSFSQIDVEMSYLPEYKGVTVSFSGAVTPYLESARFKTYLPNALLYGGRSGNNANDFNMELSLKSTRRFDSTFRLNYEHMSKFHLNMSAPRFNGELLLLPDEFLLKGKFRNDVELTISSPNRLRETKMQLNLKTSLVDGHIEIDPKKNGHSADLTFTYGGNRRLSAGGSYKAMGQKRNLKAYLKGPDFNEDLTLTLSGKLKRFKVTAKLQHNTDMYELVASNRGYYKTIEVDMILAGDKANMKFVGNLQKFKVSLDVTADRKQYKFLVSNQNYLEGVTVDVTTPEIGSVQFKFDFNGQSWVKASVTLPKHYYGISVKQDTSSFNIDLDVQIDEMKSILLEMSYVNADDRTTFFRRVTIKLDSGYTPLTLNLHLKSSSYGVYSIMTDIGTDANDKFGAKLQIKTAGQKEVLLTLMSPDRNVEAKASLESSRGQHTVVFTLTPDDRKTDEKFEINVGIVQRYKRIMLDVSIKLPAQKNELKIKNVISGIDGDTMFSWTAVLSVDDDSRKDLTVNLTGFVKKADNVVHLTLQRPYSGLSVKTAAWMSDPPYRKAIGVSHSYRSNTQRQQDYLVSIELVRQQNKVNLKIVEPGQVMLVHGQLMVGPNSFNVDVEKETDGVKTVILSAAGKKKDHDMSLNIAYNAADLGKSVAMDTKLLDDKFMMQLYHRRGYWLKGNDITLMVERRPHSVLFSSLVWNRSLFADIKEFIKSELLSFGRSARDFIGWSSEKMRYASESASDGISMELQPFLTYLDNEAGDLKSMATRYARRISNSEMLKTAATYAGRAWNAAWESYEYGVEELSRGMELLHLAAWSVVAEFRVRLDAHAAMLRAVYFTVVQHYINEVREYIAEQYDHAIAVVTFVQDEINLHITETFVGLKEFLDALANSVDNAYYKMSYVFSHNDKSTVYNLLKFPKDTFQELLRAFEYWQISDTVLAFNNRIFNYVKHRLTTTKNSILYPEENYFNFDSTKQMMAGQVNYRLASMLYEFSEYGSGDITGVADMGEKGLAFISDWSIFDVYYNIKPSSDFNNWLPPFKARATLFKSQHVITFDGRYYDFLGSCNYTLARVVKNFDLVAHFDRDTSTMEYISIKLWNDDEYMLYSDYKASWKNGSLLDLPFKNAYVTITLEGDIYTYTNTRGYSVTYNPKIDFCTLEVSGWYHGRVAGLFGSFNNEQVDDVPSSRAWQSSPPRTADMERFLNSWSPQEEKQKRCYSRNVIDEGPVDSNRDCSKMFLEYDSPHRNCFRQVTPEPYYHMCAIEVDEFSPMNTLCDVSVHYINHCYYKEVPLTIPSVCRGGSV